MMQKVTEFEESLLKQLDAKVEIDKSEQNELRISQLVEIENKNLYSRYEEKQRRMLLHKAYRNYSEYTVFLANKFVYKNGELFLYCTLIDNLWDTNNHKKNNKHEIHYFLTRKEFETHFISQEAAEVYWEFKGSHSIPDYKKRANLISVEILLLFDWIENSIKSVEEERLSEIIENAVW